MYARVRARAGEGAVAVAVADARACVLTGVCALCHRAYGVVVSMFDFHRSDRGSNPGRGGKIS